jgi:hypothetical protein
VTYPVNVYSSRRGSDYSMDQLSRFLHADARALMQRVVVDRPEDAAVADATPADAARGDAAPVDLLALLRRPFAGNRPAAAPDAADTRAPREPPA